MRNRAPLPIRKARGMVLITTILLLVVVTLLALAMLRGVGLETRIAGNVMDKQRALQAANSSEDYAEQWLVNNVTPGSGTVCSASTFSATASPAICSNTLGLSTDALSAATVPWTIGGAAVGYGYNPPSGAGNLFTTSGGPNSYAAAPTVYIAWLGSDQTNPNATDYQIDAWSYGGGTSTVAVVESTYQIIYTASGGGGP
ncbi:MAG TPA: PilX N-terminal domain-containing pilus assembly protein [Steroidobacteraceae bacterium]|jgi:type IV pilus assembly protein PilX|nr:PilX N-terminal domain-containing pilus assembly protein [Steroidobacteraceae bacterium]